MAGQRGRDVLISIGDGDEPEAFFVVAGIRARDDQPDGGIGRGDDGAEPAGVARGDRGRGREARGGGRAAACSRTRCRMR